MGATPIAVAISDLHLSLSPPACRAETDWLEVQARYLKQVEDIAEGATVLCAGDLFDRWNPPPELLHFALQHLPDGMICVPGNHDLPLHRTDLMHRSGYGVLKEAKKIRDISGGSTGNSYGWGGIFGFGCGEEITRPGSCPMAIALVHQYCWINGKSYPDAPDKSHAGNYSTALKGYKVAVFGDNHKGFLVTLRSGTKVLNCGTFIRRKSDEIDNLPMVGIIYPDGTVERRLLDTSKDKFHENAKQREETALDMKAFIDELEGLGEHGLNFREAVENHLKSNDIAQETKEITLQAIGL